MKFRVDEISSVISEEIEKYRSEIDVAEVGTVLEVGDGIARVYGLGNAMSNELVTFENGQAGQVLNLEENSAGVVVLGNYLEISEGDEVRRTGELLSILALTILVMAFIGAKRIQGMKIKRECRIVLKSLNDLREL